MKVLGIDPGTAVTGFGVIENSPNDGAPRLLECGVLRTKASDPLPERLQTIHQGVVSLLERHRPGALAVEGIFFAANARSTVILGHTRGVILLAGALTGVPVYEYSPAAVKRAIAGRGAALKIQVGVMVAKILRLTHPPQPTDAADGVAIALTHLLAGHHRRTAPR